MVRRRVVLIEIDGSRVLRQPTGPIEVVLNSDVTQRGVHGSRVRVDAESLLRGAARFRKHLVALLAYLRRL